MMTLSHIAISGLLTATILGSSSPIVIGVGAIERIAKRFALVQVALGVDRIYELVPLAIKISSMQRLQLSSCECESLKIAPRLTI